MAVRNCFIRGSVVRYIQLPAADVDTGLLQDATRREVRRRAGKRKGKGLLFAFSGTHHTVTPSFLTRPRRRRSKRFLRSHSVIYFPLCCSFHKL